MSVWSMCVLKKRVARPEHKNPHQRGEDFCYHCKSGFVGGTVIIIQNENACYFLRENRENGTGWEVESYYAKNSILKFSGYLTRIVIFRIFGTSCSGKSNSLRIECEICHKLVIYFTVILKGNLRVYFKIANSLRLVRNFFHKPLRASYACSQCV